MKRVLAIAAITLASVAALEGLIRLATHSLDEWGDWHTVDPIVGHIPREGLIVDKNIAEPSKFSETLTQLVVDHAATFGTVQSRLRDLLR